MEVKSFLTRDTFIPIGAVAAVLIVGISYGALTNQVRSLGDEVVMVRADAAEIRQEQKKQGEELATVNAKLDLILNSPKGISYAGRE